MDFYRLIPLLLIVFIVVLRLRFPISIDESVEV